MIRKSTFFLTSALLLLVLSGCGRTVEEQTDKAMQSAREAFEMNRKQPTETLEGVEIYKPVGWKVEMLKEQHTLLISKRGQTYTAQYDPNANSDSHAYYDMLLAQSDKEFIEQETFSDSGVFGFAAIRAHGDSSVEVVTGTGPVQVTAIVEKNELIAATEQMMEIARSVELEK